MFLAYGDTWKRFHTFFDFKPEDVVNCRICSEVLTKERNDTGLTCHECMLGVCGDCTIKQLVANSGVMVCCNCRHSVGTRMPSYEVAKVAYVMRYKLAYGM